MQDKYFSDEIEKVKQLADAHKELDFIVPAIVTGSPAIGFFSWLGSLFRRKRETK